MIQYLKNTIPSFPPGFEIKVSFNDTIYLLNERKNLNYTINISFKDIYGKINHEEFVINLNYLKGLFPRVPNDIDSSLHNINNNLEKMTKENKKSMNNLVKSITVKK